MCGCSSVGSKASIPQTLNSTAKQAPQAQGQQASNIPPELAALVEVLAQASGGAGGGSGLNLTA
jgi:hypothetical protein